MWWLAILITIVIALVGYAIYYARSSPYRIPAKEARQRLAADTVDVVLDVRTQMERDKFGFYEGSIHMPADQLHAHMATLYPNKDTRILVYCNTGQRARLATEILRSMGYEQSVYISDGHWALTSKK
jgi:phage shock protein E